MAFVGGPYIQAACFCDTVIEDKTGVLSLIRIVDTVTHAAKGPNPPENMEPFLYNLKLILMLKSGKARGRSKITIVPEMPTGETKDPSEMTVHFEGEERGANLIVSMAFVFELEGLYWFNVYLDDEKEKLTAIPLRVKYDRIVTTTTPAL